MNNVHSAQHNIVLGKIGRRTRARDYNVNTRAGRSVRTGPQHLSCGPLLNLNGFGEGADSREIDVYLCID